jgi:hypothetical protein
MGINMYLTMLNVKQQKLFAGLAYNVAISDGVFSDEEKELIKSYESEMGIVLNLKDIDTNIDNIISEININCNLKEKKIIVFEIIGLAMSDYNYDDGERDIVRKALDTFGLDEEFGNFCERKLSEYLKLQEELNLNILL